MIESRGSNHEKHVFENQGPNLENKRTPLWCKLRYDLDLPPTQDASGKWRFWLGFPTKNVIILVVTVTGWGVDLSYDPNVAGKIREITHNFPILNMLPRDLFPPNRTLPESTEKLQRKLMEIATTDWHTILTFDGIEIVS